MQWLNNGGNMKKWEKELEKKKFSVITGEKFETRFMVYYR